MDSSGSEFFRGARMETSTKLYSFVLNIKGSAFTLGRNFIPKGTLPKHAIRYWSVRSMRKV